METMLVVLVDDLRRDFDRESTSLFILLDFSVTVDTIDYSTF